MNNYTKKIIMFMPIILFFIIYLCLLFICIIKSDQYTPEKSDAIIVLGYGLDENQLPSEYLEARLQTALDLYNEGYAKNIIVTGGIGPKDTMPVAVAMKKWFLDKGVPSELVITEMHANNTYENFVYSKKICEERNFDKVIVVTNDFHMFRSMLMSKEFFSNASGSSASVPLSFEKIGMYLKEPLSILKYGLINKNTSQKVLEKDKTNDFNPNTTINTFEKYDPLLRKSDITTYNIKMEYDESKNIFTGTETVAFTNTQDFPITSIKMNLYHNRLKEITNSENDFITIDNIMSNNEKLYYTNNSSSIDIDVKKLKPNSQIIFTIYFTATIPKTNYTTGATDTQIWAQDFFPVVSEVTHGSFTENEYIIDTCYNNESIYTVSITTDNSYTTIMPSNTTTTVKDGKTTTKMNNTLLRNMSFALIKDVRKTSALSNSDVPVTLYHRTLDNNTYNILKSAIDTFNFMESNIASYPYRDLKIVAIYSNKPTVSYSSGMIFVDSNYIQNPNFYTELTNAVVSLWFGDMVFVETDYSFISNGLSRLISDIIIQGTDSFDEHIQRESALYKDNYTNIADTDLNSDDYTLDNYEDYYFVKHIKSKLMMNDMKNTLDDKWLNFLKVYFKIYSFSVIDDENFVILANEYTTVNIKEKFDSWVTTDDFLNIKGGNEK